MFHWVDTREVYEDLNWPNDKETFKILGATHNGSWHNMAIIQHTPKIAMANADVRHPPFPARTSPTDAPHDEDLFIMYE